MEYTIEYGCFDDQSDKFRPVDLKPGHTFPGSQTDYINVLSYINWRDYFVDMALTSFEWSNLPDGIDARAIEMCMLYQGFGGMFEDVAGKLKFAPATPQGILDMYYNPVQVRFVAPNGNGTWERRCKSDYGIDDFGNYVYLPADCVCLFDNMGRYPLMRYIDAYARRVSKMDRIVDVNIAAQSTPFIARASEMGRKDIYNKMMQITGNETVIVENNALQDDSSVDVLDTKAPFVADKILDVQSRTINQLYTIEGVDNSFNTKKEREINSEVDANNEQIMLKRKSRLEMREKFCEECNRMWDLDVSVSWAVDHNGDGKVDMSADAKLGGFADE